MRRARARVVLVMLPLALAAVACGGGEDTSEDHWIVGLLQRIPAAVPRATEVAVVDLAAAAAAAGMTVPSVGASDDEIADYLNGLPPDTLIPNLLRDPAPTFGDLTQELGIDPAQVSAAITAVAPPEAGAPPETYQILQGDFDAAAIDAAVRADPAWSDLLTTAEYQGITYFTWGEDFEVDVARVTPVRPLGRGGRLALDGRFLYWVPWTAGMEALIDAGAGAPTLADDPLFSRVARALEDSGVYTAIISAAPLVADASASGLPLGVGGGRDEAGPFWVIVAIHDGSAGAEERAAAVRSILTEGTILSTGQPWSERVTSFEVTVEGDMLVVVAHAAAGEGDWMRAYYTRELLLVAAQG